MNENAPLRIASFRIIPGSVRTGRAVHAFNRAKSNEINKKMKNLIGSINRSPLRCGFFTMTIALCWFALSPPLKAVDCPSDCDNSIGQTALGFNVLAVNTGFNNTGVGQGALQSNTSGGFNVAVGVLALSNNTTGQQNMAIGQEALANNIAGNFNMGIGFRSLFMNTGSRNSAVGAAALRNNAGASDNTAIGSTAMVQNTTGEQNTAIGSAALSSNLASNDNTAVGWHALFATTASDNTAVGSEALESNTSGLFNTAVGTLALLDNIGGDFNTGIGRRALENNLGDNNTALGYNAGADITSGDNNTCLGRNSCGDTTTGNNVVCIGANCVGENFDNRAYIPNIAAFTQNFVAGTTAFVTVRLSDGKLGHPVSSQRYKKDIKPMGDSSELIYKLKPVTYRYKKTPEFQSDTLDYGLIAEDVAEIDPTLAIRDGKGQIEGLRDMAIYNMMLNEFLKEHKKVEAQQASIADLKSTVALQQKEMQVLTAQLKEQAAQIQKVSAQIEVSKPAPRTAANR